MIKLLYALLFFLVAAVVYLANPKNIPKIRKLVGHNAQETGAVDKSKKSSLGESLDSILADGIEEEELHAKNQQEKDVVADTEADAEADTEADTEAEVVTKTSEEDDLVTTYGKIAAPELANSTVSDNNQTANGDAAGSAAPMLYDQVEIDGMIHGIDQNKLALVPTAENVQKFPNASRVNGYLIVDQMDVQGPQEGSAFLMSEGNAREYVVSGKVYVKLGAQADIKTIRNMPNFLKIDENTRAAVFKYNSPREIISGFREISQTPGVVNAELESVGLVRKAQ